jgi:hypothetical protein
MDKTIHLETKKENKHMLSTSLRRVLVASGLVIATSFMASAAFAENVVIGGTVASTLAIAATNANAAINLAPAQIDATLKVADLTMGTNNSTGLKVDLTGTLTLARTTIGQEAVTPVPFTVGIVAGASGTPTSYVATGAQVFSTSAAAAPSTAHSLYIKYSTDAAFQDPGAYDATIVLTASDN